MEVEFDESLAAEQLYSAMRVSDSVLHSRGRVEEMLRDRSMTNRAFAVDWMKKVLHGHRAEVLDSSVRIFDAYLLCNYREDPSVLRDNNRIAFAAAAAMTLGSKLCQSCNPISPSFFSVFDTDDIAFLEKKMFLAVGSRASPLASPSFFLSHLTRMCSDFADAERLLVRATALVGEFWEDARCLLFAPSTIALSAVIIALSLQKVECVALLDRLPNFFFPPAEDDAHSLFRASAQKRDYLDCKACLQAMEQLVSLRPQPVSSSPCTVGDPAVLDNFREQLPKR